jgi:hypothetical protein
MCAPGDVEFRSGAVAETRLGNQRFLDLAVFISYLNEHFEGAHLGIGASDFRRKRDKRIVVICDRCQQCGVCRFDVSPEAAPEIQFPGCVKTNVKITE